MSGNKLDINEVLRRGSLRIEREESLAELDARIAAESRSKRYSDIREMTTFFVILTVLLGVGCLCVWLAFFDPAVTADNKHWAQTILTTLITSSVTYVLGRRAGKATDR